MNKKTKTCRELDSNDFKALVFEFMANGSLENWLHPTANNINKDDQLHLNNLDFERRLSIAVDVASALNYLHHECQSPIVHCDLKPSNVLLDDDLVAHVGDFVLAKFISISSKYGMSGEVSTQGDVFSYGILVLEMFTGKRPTDDMFKDGLKFHNFCKMYASPEHVEEIIDSCLFLDVEEKHHDDDAMINYDMPEIKRVHLSRDKMRQILASIIQIGVECSPVLLSDRSSMTEVIVEVQAVKNQYLGEHGTFEQAEQGTGEQGTCEQAEHGTCEKGQDDDLKKRQQIEDAKIKLVLRKWKRNSSKQKQEREQIEAAKRKVVLRVLIYHICI
ncbi:receptor kinase-like protein Xa21 [Papaver somniferum]|uniref:receptor kinase-like protein Xa21 n=1 Tax=Papaver somniferum TaxID=3469 RepID=UPI000E6F5629|nr:receptor kinase-like protein Xa21 [Papaver somniferum]